MGPVIFIDTSVFVAILAKEPEARDLADAIAGAGRRVTSPIVRLETSVVLANRLAAPLRLAERLFDAFLEEAAIEEAPIDASIGAMAVACLETYGKGRHAARLNFADCLSYAGAKAFGARLLFKGEDFAKTDVNG